MCDADDILHGVAIILRGMTSILINVPDILHVQMSNKWQMTHHISITNQSSDRTDQSQAYNTLNWPIKGLKTSQLVDLNLSSIIITFSSSGSFMQFFVRHNSEWNASFILHFF